MRIISSILLLFLTTEVAASANVVVTTVEVYPFLIKKNGEYTGYIPDLISRVANVVGFQYELRPVKDGKYGTKLADGTWDGMIGELTRLEAGLAAAPLTYTSARERVVDFSHPFMMTTTMGYTRAIVPHTSITFKLSLLLQPFTMATWTLIKISGIVVTIAFYVIRRWNPYEKIPKEESHFSSIIASLWFILSTFTWQGYPESPRSLGGKLLSTTWFLFTVVFWVIYTVTMIPIVNEAHLPGDAGYLREVRSLPEAVKGDYMFYSIESGSTYDFFQTSQLPMHYKIHERMHTVRTIREGIAKVQDEGAIFFGESLMMDAVLTHKPCHKVVAMPTAIKTGGYSLSTPLGSPYRDNISWAILQLRDEGVLQMLEQKWWRDTEECSRKVISSDRVLPDKDAIAPLDISWMASLFLYPLLGVVFSAVVTGVEIVFYKRKQESSSTIETKE